LLIFSSWIIIDHINRIIEPLMIFDYWMFELLFIFLISSKLFKIKIYSHQIVGIIINSLVCLVIEIIRFLSLNPNSSPNFNSRYKWFIPISIIIYLLITNLTSYIYIKIKLYMDLEFIYPIKLLMLYGIIGLVFSSIACLIETLFKCIGPDADLFCNIVLIMKLIW